MRIAFLIGLSLLVSGCSETPKTKVEPASHAAAGVVAGSYEDWCGEHGVPESQCTRCNPDLIAEFKATGDWCAEHGLPESQCLECNPDIKIERPAKSDGAAADSADQPPKDRLKVRLASPETSQIVGIVTEKGRATEGDAEFVVPARLVYDSAKRAEINARSAGVVRAVLVDVGSRVRKGDPVVVLDSPEVGADRSRLAAARTKVDVAKAQLDRERALHAEGIAPMRQVQEAEGELAAAQAEVQAMEAAAGVVGGGGGSGRYTLNAPLSGVVVKRAATIGRQVDLEEVLVEIVDASILWAELDVPEARLGEARAGDAVTFTFDGIAGREFRGTLDSIAPEVDPRTRTAMARVRLANSDGALRAHMYGRARIGAATAAGGVSVPRSAVQSANGAEVVFVRITDTLYETRRVTTGPRFGDWVQVTRGIAPGEEVVTVGSFLLKTETLKGSIGAGCCEVK
jgi:cobalt-zinc-cadmium efflux system membrane fusion protein